MKNLCIAPVAAGALLIGLNAMPCQAFTTINVGGTEYNVSTFVGSYTNDNAKFNTAAAGGVMPWWGNASLAQQFAVAVGTSLGGTPDFIGSGPFFAYEINPSNISMNRSYAFNYNTLVAQQRDQFNVSTTTYVQAEAVSYVPGPLPIFGAAAAFGTARRLRRRLNTQRRP